MHALGHDATPSSDRRTSTFDRTWRRPPCRWQDWKYRDLVGIVFNVKDETAIIFFLRILLASDNIIADEESSHEPPIKKNVDNESQTNMASASTNLRSQFVLLCTFGTCCFCAYRVANPLGFQRRPGSCGNEQNPATFFTFSAIASSVPQR